MKKKKKKCFSLNFKNLSFFSVNFPKLFRDTHAVVIYKLVVLWSSLSVCLSVGRTNGSMDGFIYHYTLPEGSCST